MYNTRLLDEDYQTVEVNCSTGMLCEGYQSVAVNVQHPYVRCRLSESSGKCAARYVRCRLSDSSGEFAATVCLAASCLLQSVHLKTVFTTFPVHFVAICCI